MAQVLLKFERCFVVNMNDKTLKHGKMVRSLNELILWIGTDGYQHLVGHWNVISVVRNSEQVCFEIESPAGLF